jgi:hypothetical protein
VRRFPIEQKLNGGRSGVLRRTDDDGVMTGKEVEEWTKMMEGLRV